MKAKILDIIFNILVAIQEWLDWLIGVIATADQKEKENDR